VPLPPNFMHARVDAVRNKLNVQVCSLYQADGQQQCLEIVATSGLNQRVLGATLTYSQGVRTCSWSIRNRVAAKNGARQGADRRA